jgi:DNA-binding transcriptional MerR regulator
MRIGDLAIQAGVTTKTIRYYESVGLVAPPRRTPAGYRDYDQHAIERLRFIRDAQTTGLSLSEIQSILELKDSGQGTCDHTKSLLLGHLAELDRQIERLAATRMTLLELTTRVLDLDPTECTDPARCQVIEKHGHGPGQPAGSDRRPLTT